MSDMCKSFCLFCSKNSMMLLQFSYYLFLAKNVLLPFRQSYYIIFLHPVVKKTCTHFIYTYLLSASSYYVNRQIGCMGAIVCHNSGETEEVSFLFLLHFIDLLILGTGNAMVILQVMTKLLLHF